MAQNRDNGEPGEPASLNVIATGGVFNPISLAPDSLTFLPEGKATFNISALDQFVNELADSETNYAVSCSTGTIDQQGRFTSSQNAGASTNPLTVTVSSNRLDLNDAATIVIRPGSLPQIILEPQSVSTSLSVQPSFSMLAIEEFGNPLSNVVTTFKADIAAGQIDAFGRFTAGA